jgi:hypothetical protein
MVSKADHRTRIRKSPVSDLVILHDPVPAVQVYAEQGDALRCFRRTQLADGRLDLGGAFCDYFVEASAS